MERFLKQIDEIKLAYDSYVEWELKGGKELLLGANRLTNRQLFWIAFARARYRKELFSHYKFFYDGNEYDLNTFDTIKEAFNCKEKTDLETTADSCSENYHPVHRPVKDDRLEVFKKILLENGFIDNINSNF